MVIEADKTSELIESALALSSPKSEARRLASGIRTGSVKETVGNLGELAVAYASEGGSLNFLRAPVASMSAAMDEEWDDNLVIEPASVPSSDMEPSPAHPSPVTPVPVGQELAPYMGT